MRMSGIRDIHRLRTAAADFRRLAEKHDEAGNHGISRKLTDVAAGLESEADEFTAQQSSPDKG
jgi:hypothetical protein